MKKNQMLFKLMWTVGFILTGLFLSACGLQLKPTPLFSNSSEDKTDESSDEKSKLLTLACWNAQTFFDAVTDGCEYTDFKNSSKWTKEKYVKRLDKLCEIMTLLNADVTVLEEIENEAVVQDIANRLTDGAWNKKKGWQYACFAKERDGAIGCAVFSRYELKNLSVHTLDIQVHETKQPAARPIMQLTVSVGEKELVLFVNHWKSKSGGQEETEIWRDWQEALLAERLSDFITNNRSLVVCGDFNRSAEDFVPVEENYCLEGNVNLLLRRANGEVTKLYSPWFNDDGKFSTEIGSYYYDESWERIDNFFFSGKIEINQFQPVAESPLADEASIPQGYKQYTDSGCSDHLPLKCIISI